MNQNSIWLSLKNRKFRTLWLVTLISGSAVAAYNTATVWLMNSLESSSFFISLIPVVTSLAFFLFLDLSEVAHRFPYVSHCKEPNTLFLSDR